MPRHVYEVRKVGARYRVLEVPTDGGPAQAAKVVGVFDSYEAAQGWVERTVLRRRVRVG